MSPDLSAVDLMSRDHKRDPFPYYARLRSEAPVFQTHINGIGKVWLITRYDDVIAVLKDKRFAKDPRNAGRKVREPHEWEIRIMSHNLLRFDDPAHLRLRTMAAKAFRQAGVEGLKDRIAAIVDTHLDRMAMHDDGDLVRDFAHPVPLMLISELMGIPDDTFPKMHRWMEEATSLSGPPDMALLSEFLRYLQHLAMERRRSPRDDLLSALGKVEQDGDHLNDDELVATAVAILIAGHETAVNLLSSGALSLMQHPAERDRLLADTDLAPSAVEELLRFSAPVESATERFCVEDIDFQGQSLKRGDVVLAVLSSANRDETKFTAADRLDIARTPNPHIAFGFGAHFCMGAALAQMQGEIAFVKLFQRFPTLTPAIPEDRLPWKEMPILRGLSALPVTW